MKFQFTELYKIPHKEYKVHAGETFFVVTQFIFKRRESHWNIQQGAMVNFGAAKLVLYVIEKTLGSFLLLSSSHPCCIKVPGGFPQNSQCVKVTLR